MLPRGSQLPPWGAACKGGWEAGPTSWMDPAPTREEPRPTSPVNSFPRTLLDQPSSRRDSQAPTPPSVAGTVGRVFSLPWLSFLGDKVPARVLTLVLVVDTMAVSPARRPPGRTPEAASVSQQN